MFKFSRMSAFYKRGIVLLTLACAMQASLFAGNAGSNDDGGREEKISTSQVLLIAATNGSVEEIKDLLDVGADINARDGEGKTPLMLATSFGHLSAMIALLKAGADPNARDFNGDTALILAAQYGFASAITILAQYSADLELLDRFGDTALQVAEEQIQSDAAETLEDLLANMNLEDEANIGRKKRTKFDTPNSNCRSELPFVFKRYDDDRDEQGDGKKDFAMSFSVAGFQF